MLMVALLMPSLFHRPGWNILTCPTPQCTLKGGGNYIALASPSNTDVTIVVETFQHENSQCIRMDPKTFPAISAVQTVTIVLPQEFVSSTSTKSTADANAASSAAGKANPKHLEVFQSCTGWRYPVRTNVPLATTRASRSSAYFFQKFHFIEYFLGSTFSVL